MKKLLIILVILLLSAPVFASEYPLQFTDSTGANIVLPEKVTRVVSLVPSVTEMLLRIGATDVVKGVTFHSVLPPESAEKTIVGGFFSPDLDLVAGLEPELVFYADLQTGVVPRFKNKVILVNLSAKSIEETFTHLRLLGRMFGREIEAEKIIAEEERQLAVIADKVALIPKEKRKRVMRLMGRNRVMTPGDDSFQNEYIRAAGGIPPHLGRNGNITGMTLDEWQKFNPQLVYGCGGDRQTLTILDRPKWQEVEAVKDEKVLFFPCALTCRAATHPGYFTAWLAARIYGDEFSDPSHFVRPEQVVARKPLALDFGYVQNAEIIESDIKDFRNKTLTLHLNKPMTVVSTLEGQRDGISTVANHYFPPPAWGLGHKQGLQALRESTQRILGFDPATTAMLFTGANMDHLALVTKTFKDMKVTALVTAGVMGNAVRMGADTGSYYEPEAKKPGTINILLLTNMTLSPRAMTRAIISATEAKTAALQDMDIRSSYTRPINQATGTGTDNIIVIEGDGPPIDSSGGHSKMGELMARAVYAGVQQAVHQQNGLVAGRPVFQRLKERKISLWTVAAEAGVIEQRDALETLLLQPEYAGFITSLMAISDDVERGLIADPASVDQWCHAVAGGDFNLIDFTGMTPVIAKGFSALAHRVQ